MPVPSAISWLFNAYLAHDDSLRAVDCLAMGFTGTGYYTLFTCGRVCISKPSQGSMFMMLGDIDSGGHGVAAGPWTNDLSDRGWRVGSTVDSEFTELSGACFVSTDTTPFGVLTRFHTRQGRYER